MPFKKEKIVTDKNVRIDAMHIMDLFHDPIKHCQQCVHLLKMWSVSGVSWKVCSHWLSLLTDHSERDLRIQTEHYLCTGFIRAD